MAVNLRATATLNTKPFTAGIRSIKAATESLNKSAVSGSAAVTSGVLAEKTAREATSRVVRQNQQAVTTAAASNARAINQTAQSLNDYNKLQQESVKVSRQIANAYQNMSRADANHYANQKRLAQQRLALMRAQASGLEGPALQPYIDRVGRAEIAAAKSRAALTAATERQTAANNRLAASQTRVGSTGARAASGLAAQRYLFHDLSRQAMMTATIMGALPVIGLATAAMWENKFVDVVRTADPAFSQVQTRVEALRGSLVSMVQAMPVSFTQVTEIATLANQMGIASTQVAEFTRATAMFSATSGVSVDMAATAFGRLTSILGDNRIGFMEMADSILKVGVNSVATEAEIINVTTQISSIAAQAGFTAQEMIGLSGALASVRVPPELSRGLITRVFGQIDKAVSAGSTGLDTLARISGRTSEEFRKQWGREGSADLFNDFLKGLRNAGQQASSELESLSITSVRDKPVLLRLANAADSEGAVGELFTQTLRDANNAAGETQRQYVLMADTVVNKLKVLGNNVLAFFDTVGRGSLSGFGEFIDDMSEGIRTFTRDLDKPAAVLGEMFGVTNSDALGFIAKLALITSGLTLAASIALKFAGVWKATAHAVALFGGKTGITSALTGMVNTMTSVALAARGLNTGIATASGTMVAATGKAQTLGGAFRGLATAIGPIGWAAAAAAAVGIFALSSYNKEVQALATSAESVSIAFSQIDLTQLDRLDNVLSNIQVAAPKDFSLGLILENTRPFADGVESYRSNVESLVATRELYEGKFLGSLAEWMHLTEFGDWDIVKGVETVDKSFQKLVDAGNTQKATELIRSLYKTGEELSGALKLDGAANQKDFLQNAFDLAGIEMTDRNLDRFARGTLPQVTDALYGAVGATKALDEVFEDVENLGKFSTTLDDAAAAFIDFGSAIELATTKNSDGVFESFSLPDFTSELRKQVADQEQWAADITEISRHGSSGVIESLAALGPEGRHAATALAQGLRDGTPEAQEALAALEASVVAEAAGIGNAIAETMANQAWASRILGSEDLARTLAASLGDDKMSQLYEAADGVGSETVERILQALARDGDFEKALTALLSSQEVTIVPELSTEEAERGFQAMTKALKNEGKIPLAAEVINAETTIGEFKRLVKDPELSKIDIEGTLTMEEAYATSREFQVWAAAQGIDMFLGANDLPARTTMRALLAAYTDETIAIAIEALPEPAEGELWDFVQLTNGTRAFVLVDGDGKPVEGKLAEIVDKTGKTVGTMQVTANDSSAQSVVNRWNNRTVGTAYINLQAIDSVRVPSSYGSGSMWAEGGIAEYYAKGGMREDHRPQIAPAGAMRVWAEPETGGEAYIPFAQDRRKRAVGILGAVADRFGYELASKGNNVIQYNNGGAYNASRMFRTTRSEAGSRRSSGSQGKWEFHVHNPQHVDPLQDLWDKVNTYNPGFGFDDD